MKSIAMEIKDVESDGDATGDESYSKKRRKKYQGAYKELNQRISRCKELEIVTRKMQTQKDLMVNLVTTKLYAS